jgi:GNAT superfamily N-acetyltransferase
VLTDRGAVVSDTVQVLALELSDLPAGDPAVHWEIVHDEQTLRDARQVYREVWGGPEPSADRWERDLAEVALPVGEREAFQLVAYVEGEPASAGGCTRAADVARLWGAATRPAWRGHGAYRAVVAARLDLAREHGATLGLVKGLVTTSGPILRRLGFTAYGEERLLTLDL